MLALLCYRLGDFLRDIDSSSSSDRGRAIEKVRLNEEWGIESLIDVDADSLDRSGVSKNVFKSMSLGHLGLTDFYVTLTYFLCYRLGDFLRDIDWGRLIEKVRLNEV